MKTTICLFGTLALMLGGSQAAETKTSQVVAKQCAELSDAAVVRTLRGSAVVTLPGTDREQVLRVGMKLPEGSTIQTKANAVADLAMVENGVVIRVTPGTKVSLEKLRYFTSGKQTIRTHTVLNVPQGKVLSNGPRLKKESIYEVITRRQKIS